MTEPTGQELVTTMVTMTKILLKEGIRRKQCFVQNKDGRHVVKSFEITQTKKNTPPNIIFEY